MSSGGSKIVEGTPSLYLRQGGQASSIGVKTGCRNMRKNSNIKQRMTLLELKMMWGGHGEGREMVIAPGRNNAVTVVNTGSG